MIAGFAANEADLLVMGWLRHGDFLLVDMPSGVDLVVGNPPYIRLEHVEKQVAEAYRARWSTMRGRSDIYVGFYERALSSLAPGGRLGFICTDRWMNNAYGKNLREFMTSRYAIESV